MENRNRFLLCFSVGILLLLLNLANAENRTEPRRNVNLSPFEKWRSAYFCMQNMTNSCTGKDILTLSGWLSVVDSEIRDYCDKGCHAQTLVVMQCIQDVHRHFKFETGAPLAFVKDTIVNACSNYKGFNTTYKADPNSASSLYATFYMPLLSTLITMALIATFT
ncbi:uncharacterized protein G2W53_016178 [Senna tora]|uniref:DUF7731 domain-containing protein n=1 Tax=Senna tora TaxID=362788 RepID=A0A834WWX5_9FABA|nr:uncharacterized protein G2W53_016178 [Senna tora]